MFHCSNSVLWTIGLSLFSPNIGDISMAEQLKFRLIRPHNSLPISRFLKVVFSKLKSGLQVSLLQKWRSSWSVLYPRSPFLCNARVTVFSETSNPDFARSLTNDLAVVLGLLDTSRTSFCSRVFEIFAFLPLPEKFCITVLSLNFLMIPLTAVLDTWKVVYDRHFGAPRICWVFCWSTSFAPSRSILGFHRGSLYFH